MAEPDIVHATRLFGKVSLHDIERLFMQVRRGFRARLERVDPGGDCGVYVVPAVLHDPVTCV